MRTLASSRQQRENTFILQLLIILACMNFMGHGSLCFMIASVYELFRRKGSLLLNRNALAVGLFTLFVIVACTAHYQASESLKALNYLLVYLIGYNGYRQAADPTKFVTSSAFAICFGFGVELVLMYFYNLDSNRETVRSMYSVWTGELIAVTLLGLLVSAVIGFSFYAFFCTKRIGLKIVVALLLVTGVWISIDTATRTPLILLAVHYAIMGFLYLHNKKGVKYFKVLFTILFGLGLLALLYQVDFIGVKSFYMKTPLYTRFEEFGTDTSRFEIMGKFLTLMPKYPWGGLNIRNEIGIQAHNFLQEGYDLYGILAFIPLVAIAFQIVGNCIKLAVRKNKQGVDFLLLSMYLALFLQMCLEPVFNGYPILIWSILLIHGAASAYLSETRSRRFSLPGEESE